MLLVQSEVADIHVDFAWRFVRIEHEMHLEVIAITFIPCCALEGNTVRRPAVVGGNFHHRW